MDWEDYWSLFSTVIECDTALNDAERSVLLIKAMGSTKAREIATAAAQNTPKYDSAVNSLKRYYGKPRAVYPYHISSFFHGKAYEYSQSDIQDALSFSKKHLSGMKRCGGDTLSQVAAAWLQQRFTGTLAYEWDVHSSDITEPPTEEKLFECLEFHLTTLTVRETAQPHQKKLRTDYKRSSSPPRSEAETTSKHSGCLLCPGQFHGLFNCPVFTEMSVSKRQAHVKSHHLCIIA